MKYIFIGSNPSTKNENPNTPFVGTNSWKVLRLWISYINIKLEDCVFMNCSNKVLGIKEKLKTSDVDLSGLHEVLSPDCKVFALGNFADLCLNLENIPHFKLPHPSGRNRKLNDHEFEKLILNEARYFAHFDRDRAGLKLVAM